MSSAVRLSLLSVKDGEELTALARASVKLHRPWLVAPTTLAAFGAYFSRTRSDAFVSFVVRRKADDAAVGTFNLSQIFRGNFQSAYLAYWVGAPYAGQGYMSAGLELTLAQTFGPLGLHRVEANIQPGNEASIALVRRAGFQLEGFSPAYLKVLGRWRDHQRWAKVRGAVRASRR